MPDAAPPPEDLPGPPPPDPDEPPPEFTLLDPAELAVRLDRVRARLALVREVAAEPGSGVTLSEPVALPPIPVLPPGTSEVFSLLGTVEGTYFRFGPPPEIRDREAWETRPRVPNCPLYEPLLIGCELHGMPADVRHIGGGPIRLCRIDGDVYWIDPDDYVFLYRHPEEEVDIHVLAPDVVTFVDEFVLGARYPELVDAVLGPGAREHRIRRGRLRGQHTDSWLRLLTAAGVVS